MLKCSSTNKVDGHPIIDWNTASDTVRNQEPGVTKRYYRKSYRHERRIVSPVTVTAERFNNMPAGVSNQKQSDCSTQCDELQFQMDL